MCGKQALQGDQPQQPNQQQREAVGLARREPRRRCECKRLGLGRGSGRSVCFAFLQSAALVVWGARRACAAGAVDALARLHVSVLLPRASIGRPADAHDRRCFVDSANGVLAAIFCTERAPLFCSNQRRQTQTQEQTQQHRHEATSPHEQTKQHQIPLACKTCCKHRRNFGKKNNK